MSNAGTTAYPGAIDTFNNPTGGTTYEDDPNYGHENLHAQVHEAIEAIETWLGTHSGTLSIATQQGIERLTNKTLTTPQIDDATADHQYQINGSELTADRTLWLPVLTNTGTVVVQDVEQTLTNKTISGGTVNNVVVGTPAITGGTATSLQLVTPVLPTGMPLQFAPLSVTTTTGTTINTGTLTFLFQGTITPTRSDSKIYAFGVANGIDNVGVGRVTVDLRQNTTSGGTTGTVIATGNVAQDSTSSNGESSLFLMGSYAPGTTTTQYVKMVFQKGDAGGTPSSYINRFNEQSAILLAEIK